MQFITSFTVLLLVAICRDFVTSDVTSGCMTEVHDPSVLFGSGSNFPQAMENVTKQSLEECIQDCCNLDTCDVMFYDNNSNGVDTEGKAIQTTATNCILYTCHPLTACDFGNIRLEDGIDMFLKQDNSSASDSDASDGGDGENGDATTTGDVGETTNATSSPISEISSTPKPEVAETTSSSLTTTLQLNSGSNGSRVDNSSTSAPTTVVFASTTQSAQTNASTIPPSEYNQTVNQTETQGMASDNSTIDGNGNPIPSSSTLPAVISTTSPNTTQGATQAVSGQGNTNTSTVLTTMVSQIPRPHAPFNMSTTTTTTHPAPSGNSNNSNGTQNATVSPEALHPNMTDDTSEMTNDTTSLSSTTINSNRSATPQQREPNKQETTNTNVTPNSTAEASSVNTTMASNSQNSTQSPINNNTVSRNDTGLPSTTATSTNAIDKNVQNNNTSTTQDLPQNSNASTSIVNGTSPMSKNTNETLPSLASNGTTSYNNTSTYRTVGFTEETVNIFLICALAFGCMFMLLTVGVLGKRIYDGYRKRHYSRLDYLINGMYN